MTDPGHEYESQKSERRPQLILLTNIFLPSTSPEFRRNLRLVTSRPIHTPRSGSDGISTAMPSPVPSQGCVEPQSTLESNQRIWPVKAGQAWSNLKLFPRGNPDATRNTHVTPREPFLHHFALLWTRLHHSRSGRRSRPEPQTLHSLRFLLLDPPLLRQNSCTISAHFFATHFSANTPGWEWRSFPKSAAMAY